MEKAMSKGSLLRSVLHVCFGLFWDLSPVIYIVVNKNKLIQI